MNEQETPFKMLMRCAICKSFALHLSEQESVGVSRENYVFLVDCKNLVYHVEYVCILCIFLWLHSFFMTLIRINAHNLHELIINIHNANTFNVLFCKNCNCSCKISHFSLFSLKTAHILLKQIRLYTWHLKFLPSINMKI